MRAERTYVPICRAARHPIRVRSKALSNLIYLVLAVILIFAAYVRVAPSAPERWHVDPTGPYETSKTGALMRMPGRLADLHPIAMATPRVKVLAGSVEAGHITYIARSMLWGFPDYVSVRQVGEELVIYSRLRFGSSDLGVNAKRLRAWAEAMGLGPEEAVIAGDPSAG